MNVPSCSTVIPFRRYPQVCCHEHGRQPSGYWLCRHIRDGAEVSLRIPATMKMNGILLCWFCVNSGEQTIAPDMNLVCPLCAHAAALTDSPELHR